MSRRFFATWGDRLAVALLLLVTWQVVSSAAGEFWIASPWSTLKRLGAELFRGTLLYHAKFTLWEAAAGCVLGGVPGVILPFILYRFRFANVVLQPFIAGAYGIPKVAIAPLFILWFGIDLESKIAVVVSVVFFLVFYYTEAGIAALEVRLVNMARVVGASSFTVARSIILPNAFPYILTGFRISVPYAIGAAFITELISSNRGLGFVVQQGATDFETALVFAALIATAMMTFGALLLVDFAEKYLLRWRPLGPQGLASAGA